MSSRGCCGRVWRVPSPQAHHGSHTQPTILCSHAYRNCTSVTMFVQFLRRYSASNLPQHHLSHTFLSTQVTDTKTRRGARKGSTSSSSSSSSSAPADPLSSMLDGTDPLSLFAAASVGEAPTMSHSASAGVSSRRRFSHL